MGNAPAGISAISVLIAATGAGVAPAWAGAGVAVGANVGEGGGATVAMVGSTIGVKATVGTDVERDVGAAVVGVSDSKEQLASSIIPSQSGATLSNDIIRE